jgi:ribosome biogenesis protein ENP2
VGTADRKILKIWEREEKGRVYCSVEPPADINDVCYVGTSGLIFMAAEQSKCMSYFIPSLGPAPKWCSFLENLTEEMEEDQQGIYEDYKFVTKEELER